MSNPTYRYNPVNCRYERNTITLKDVIVYALSVIVVAAAIFSVILYLHNNYYETAREAQFRKENTALAKHRIVLAGTLEGVEQEIQDLKNKDLELYQKFFAVDPSGVEAQTQLPAAKLSHDEQFFQEMLAKVSEKSSRYLQQSRLTNDHFAHELTGMDLKLLLTCPTLVPVENLTAQQFVSGFGQRINPYHKGVYHHDGVDIALPRGTNILATADGKVVDVNRDDLQAGYGNYIEIDHGNGFTSRYAHLESIAIKSGDWVKKGSVIGTSGNSGGSIAPHLHYEITKDGNVIDPLMYLLEGIAPGEYEKLKKVGYIKNQSLD